MVACFVEPILGLILETLILYIDHFATELYENLFFLNFSLMVLLCDLTFNATTNF